MIYWGRGKIVLTSRTYSGYAPYKRGDGGVTMYDQNVINYRIRYNLFDPDFDFM